MYPILSSLFISKDFCRKGSYPLLYSSTISLGHIGSIFSIAVMESVQLLRYPTPCHSSTRHFVSSKPLFPFFTLSCCMEWIDHPPLCICGVYYLLFSSIPEDVNPRLLCRWCDIDAFGIPLVSTQPSPASPRCGMVSTRFPVFFKTL